MTRIISISTLIVFIFFYIPLTSYCVQQNESQISVNTYFLPNIYVKLTDNNSNNFIKSVKIDEKQITNYEYTQFSIPKNKKLIPVLLIENSKKMVDLGYDIQTMNLLLRIKPLLPDKENTVTFTFSSELEQIKGSILTINFSNDTNARLIDSLILVTNIIKNIDGYPFIVIIGTGEDRGSKAEKFLPIYPIVYIDAGNNVRGVKEIDQIAELSSGFSINLSDVSDYNKIEERIKKNLSSNTLLLLLKIPFKYSLFKEHNVALELTNGKKYLEKFNINGSSIVIPWFIITLFVIITGYYVCYSLKRTTFRKDSQRNKDNNNNNIGWLEVYFGNGKKKVIIDNREFMIGSGDICNLQIDDFEISALHCIIKNVENGFELIDLNSRNGIYVNSLKVSSKLLEDDDFIRVGSTIMIFKKRVITSNET